MDFLAQVCFADSHDIARMPSVNGRPDRPIPGDVLLVFCDGQWCTDWVDERDAVHFEWHRLGLPNLMKSDQVPERRWPVTPAHAQIHRTVDYLEQDDPECDPTSVTPNDELGLLIAQATKIGGLAWGSQGDPELPGYQLCMIGSLNPFGETWPLLNVERNPNGNNYLDHELLMIGDVGEMNISIDENGELHWSVSCG